MSIQLTRTPTKGNTTTKRVTPPKEGPSSSPAAAAAKTEAVPTEVNDEIRKGKRPVLANAVANAGTDAAATTTTPTHVPSYFPTYVPSYAPTMSSGKSRKVDPDDYDDDAVGKAAKGSGKSGKSSPFVDYCAQSFEKAWEANVEAGKVIAETREEMKEQCNFDTTNTPKSPFTPNLACPFIYTPDTGFLDEKEEVIEYFENITGSNETGIAFFAFQMYCECAKGLNEKCVTKIPDIPPIDDTGLDYCIFASIWNGDIALEKINTLDEEVQECGCTFVGTEKEGVADCPGLALGDNFIDPLTA